MNTNIKSIILKEVAAIKDRVNDVEKKLSDFSETLSSHSNECITDLEIARIENERAITELEIRVLELEHDLLG